MSGFTCKRGDTRTALKATLLSAKGVPEDLTGAHVRVMMAAPDSTNLVVDREALIYDASAGVVLVVWDPSEVQVAGTFRAEFEVRYPDGKIESYPNAGFIPVNIVPDMG